MDLETKKKGEVIFLKPLCKNIDVTCTTDFKARIIDLIHQGNNFFLLNLSEVDFMDSSGLGAVITILKTLTLNNGDIVLCGLQTPISSLFKLTRMDRVFQIYPNQEEAYTQLMNKKNSLCTLDP